MLKRHKQLLSQKKNRLRKFFFALLTRKPLRNGGSMFKLEHGQTSGTFVTEYSGNSEKITIDEQIDGQKIEGIGAFAFSEHRELTEITLPDTIAFIGAHAFYNCRNLKKISLSDRVTDIGDGAFKNCYNISEICIKMTGSSMKCLKGILSEVNNEVTVTIEYAENTAVLVFPYYLYNYEENTPARIVNQITEGSGIQYRECIEGEDVNYVQYDRLFEAGLHIDVMDSAWKIACCRLKYPYKLGAEAKERYTKFISENMRTLINNMTRGEDYGALNMLLSMEMMDRDDCSACIDAAREESCMEGLGILLAYQKAHFGTSHRKFEF